MTNPLAQGRIRMGETAIAKENDAALRPYFAPASWIVAAQFGASPDDDDTALPGLSMHQTPVLEPSRLREREAE
jgi:hypothetical protein